MIFEKEREKEANSKQKQLRFNSDGTISLPEKIQKDLEKSKREYIRTLDIWEDNEEDYSLLYHKEDSISGFNLYNDGNKLNSLKFSNGKTQEDVVKEVVNHINNGKKIVFIKGMCGTGKSIIALNIAKELGRASIVVPGKSLQKQYMQDYTKGKYVLKNDHKKLKIKVITGRDNHACLFKRGVSADDFELPCKIEIKEKNIDKIKEYLRDNPKVSKNLELEDVRRISIAPVCPYWSPIVPAHMDLNLSAVKKNYKGINNTEFNIYQRKPGCSYYQQFNSYLDSEVMVFNSAKYLLESLMNRKPATDVEIIDECDEFLDNFSSMKSINLNRFLGSINNIFIDDKSRDYFVQKIKLFVNEIILDPMTKNFALKKEIFNLKDTRIYELISMLTENYDILDEVDEDSYAHSVYETAFEFHNFPEDVYLRFRIEERGIIVDMVTINIARRFKELMDKNKSLVLMSGTIHSEKILKDIFGIEDFVIVDAEIQQLGEIKILKTGYEIDCKYENFRNGNNTREQYLISLDKAVEKAVKPVLIHVHSFDDLPSEDEKMMYNLQNLITKNKLITNQSNGNDQEMINKFKKGEINCLFTSKCAIGVDFPGEQCRSIIFTKYPNPHVDSIFWRILKKTHPTYYWEFYKDKANREFLQKLYRGLRSKDDWVYILSPDSRVLEAADNLINDR